MVTRLVPAVSFRFHWKMVQLDKPNGRAPFVQGGVQSPKFPLVFRRLASRCLDIAVAKAVHMVHEG